MSRPDTVSQLILETLHEHHALTAPEIVQHLQEKGEEFNKTSIYRALDRLQENEQICRSIFEGTTAVYERRDHHHDHLVCTECGCVQTVECTISLPEEIDGFRVNHHHLTIFGICAECAHKNELQNEPGQATP